MKYQKGSTQRIRRGALSVRACLGIVVTVGSAACAPPPNPQHQTVEFYRANADARQAMLVKCENDPGALGQTPDCVNAHQAKRMEEPLKSLRDLPPLGLTPETKKEDSQGAGESPRTSDATQKDR